MRVIRRLSPTTLLVVLAAVNLQAAQAQNATDFSKVRIKNFGCINENYYRGAQPKEQGYQDLAELGVKTVIDLRRGGMKGAREIVEAAGMKYINIPLSDRSRPAFENVAKFLEIVNDPANQPVFVHCRGGRHRAGIMTAILRMTEHDWSPDLAWEEMKKFQFNRGFGHGALKDYVFEYYALVESRAQAEAESR